MVATTSLCYGIDYATVRFVYWFGEPYNSVEFVQMAARGGRDGHMCIARLFPLPQNKSDTLDKVLIEFKTTPGCLRTPLSRRMDGRSVTCHGLPDTQLCGHCADVEPVIRVMPTISNGPIIVASILRDHETQLANIVKAIYDCYTLFESVCVHCAVAGRAVVNHTSEQCPLVDTRERSTLGTAIQKVRDELDLNGFVACTYCHFPQHKSISGAMELHIHAVNPSANPCNYAQFALNLVLAILSSSRHYPLLSNIPLMGKTLLHRLFTNITEVPCSPTNPNQYLLGLHFILVLVVATFEYCPTSVKEVVSLPCMDLWKRSLPTVSSPEQCVLDTLDLEQIANSVVPARKRRRVDTTDVVPRRKLTTSQLGYPAFSHQPAQSSMEQ